MQVRQEVLASRVRVGREVRELRRTNERLPRLPQDLTTVFEVADAQSKAVYGKPMQTISLSIFPQQNASRSYKECSFQSHLVGFRVTCPHLTAYIDIVFWDS